MRPTLLSLALALAVAPMLGCGGPSRYRAQGTPNAPGVDAEILVGKTEGVQQIDLVVEHLTEPDRLTPGATQYAVWVVPEGGQPIYSGALAVDRGSRVGRLRATTPYERFDVLVTAEPDTFSPRAWPTGALVLERRVP